jgi:hypothetical protein
MHTASLSFAVTPFLAQKFGHHLLYVHTLSYGLAVAAVGLGDHIFLFQGGADTHPGSFFAYTKVGGPVNLAFHEKSGGGFLKCPGLYHFKVQIPVYFPGQFHPKASSSSVVTIVTYFCGFVKCKIIKNGFLQMYFSTFCKKLKKSLDKCKKQGILLSPFVGRYFLARG